MIEMAVIIAATALLMFCCWFGFIAHAWADDSYSTCIPVFLFVLGPFLAWRAWRGSVVSGISIFAGVLLVWVPPWVIVGLPEMLVVSVIAVLGGLVSLYYVAAVRG